MTFKNEDQIKAIADEFDRVRRELGRVSRTYAQLAPHLFQQECMGIWNMLQGIAEVSRQVRANS